MQLITVAFATFTALIFLLGLLPFRFATKMMPLVSTGLGYGMWVAYAHYPVAVSCAAIAGMSTLVARWAISTLPSPWSLNDAIGRTLEVQAAMRRPKHRKPKKIKQEPEARGPIGNRIAKL